MAGCGVECQPKRGHMARALWDPQTKGGDNCLSLGASSLIREAQPLPLRSFQSERGT